MCLCFSFSQTNPPEYLKSDMSSSSAYKHISVFFLWFSFFHRSIWLCYELSISVCHLMLHKSIFLCFSFSCTKASGCVVSKTIWHLELLFCCFSFSKPSVFPSPAQKHLVMLWAGWWMVIDEAAVLCHRGHVMENTLSTEYLLFPTICFRIFRP